jgi:hypothetical protein
MGGRSALMGGTGVALGVDGAAPFLNPATLTRFVSPKIAFSSHFYSFSREHISDFHQPGAADESQFGPLHFPATSESHQRVHSVPDSVCYFFPLWDALKDRQRLSLCLSKTEEHQMQFTALGYRGNTGTARLDQGQTFDVDWSRFHFGPTWGIAVSDRLSFGAALLVAFTRYQQEIVASSVVEDIASGAASTSTYESIVSTFSWDLAPRLGATYKLSDRFTVGASVTVPLLHVLGGIRETYTIESNNSRTQWSGDAGFHAMPPAELRLGFGGEWESVRFEVDGFLTAGSSHYVHGNIDHEEVTADAGQITSREASTLKVNEATNPTLNLALGAEVFVGRRLSLLSGLQTDLNALKKLDPAAAQARLFRTRLDYYRASAGICSYTDFGNLIFGLRFEYGTGRALPINALVSPPAATLSSAQELGLMFVLAGSVNWQSISQAAGDVSDVVRGRAGTPPAKPPEPLQAPKQQ